MNHDWANVKKVIAKNIGEIDALDIYNHVRLNNSVTTSIGYISIGEYGLLRVDIYALKRSCNIELSFYHKYDSFGDWYYKHWLYFTTAFRNLNICECGDLEALNLDTEKIKIGDVELKLIYFGQYIINLKRCKNE